MPELNPIQLLLSMKSTIGPQLKEAGTQIEAFSAKVGVADNAVAGAAKKAGGFAEAIGGLGGIGAMAGIVALGAAVGAVGGVIESTRRRVDDLATEAQQLNNIAAKTGADQSGLMATRKQLEDMGISADSLTTSLKFLQKNIAENSAAVQHYGITAQDSMGALMQVADLFQQMPDGPEKTTMALELLGSRGGQALIPFLDQGSAKISEFNKQLLDQGVALDDLSIARFARFKVASNDLHDELEGLSNRIATDLLPTMESLVSVLDRLAKSANNIPSWLRPSDWSTRMSDAEGGIRSRMLGGRGGGGTWDDSDLNLRAGMYVHGGGTAWSVGESGGGTSGGGRSGRTGNGGSGALMYGPYPASDDQNAMAEASNAFSQFHEAANKANKDILDMTTAVTKHSQAAEMLARGIVGSARDVVTGTQTISSAFKNLIADIMSSVAEKKLSGWITTGLEVLGGIVGGPGGAAAGGGIGGGIKEGIKSSATIINVSALSAKDIVRSTQSGEIYGANRSLALTGRMP